MSGSALPITFDRTHLLWIKMIQHCNTEDFKKLIWAFCLRKKLVSKQWLFFRNMLRYRYNEKEFVMKKKVFLHYMKVIKARTESILWRVLLSPNGLRLMPAGQKKLPW